MSLPITLSAREMRSFDWLTILSQSQGLHENENSLDWLAMPSQSVDLSQK